MALSHYKARPLTIVATQFQGETQAILDWQKALGKTHPCTAIRARGPRKVEIKTLEGPVFPLPGDYIVCGTEQEFYVVKKEIFEKKYEPCT